MLPHDEPFINWEYTPYPYTRIYIKNKMADWETNTNFCYEQIFSDIKYHSKLLLDLIDMALFDFITGNIDRHHYERISSLSKNSFLIHLDNGKSFIRADFDELFILAPLKQCCLIRYSTFNQMKYLYRNKFSKLLDKSLMVDSLYPILTINHYEAVDRRLRIILNTVNECVERYSPVQVVVDDGF